MKETFGSESCNQVSVENEKGPQILEVREHGKDVTLYIFKNLGIVIDTSGKNYKELPELKFGPYNNETNEGSLSQPVHTMEGVDMDYVTNCIKEVVKLKGVNTFWFYPFGGDSPSGNQERRERARMKLLKKSWPLLEPATGGYGYFVSFQVVK